MSRSESIPGKVSGAWVFKGTYLPVATVIENLKEVSEFALITTASPSRGKGGAPLMLKSTQTQPACANT